MSALNYTQRVEYSYEQYQVTPDIACGTIARYAGTWDVVMVVCEWCTSAFLKSIVDGLSGYVVTMSQPAKVSEEVDMLNCTITGKKRRSA